MSKQSSAPWRTRPAAARARTAARASSRPKPRSWSAVTGSPITARCWNAAFSAGAIASRRAARPARRLGGLDLEQAAHGPRLLVVHGRGVEVAQRVVDVAGGRAHPPVDLLVARGPELADDLGRHARPAQAAVGGVDGARDRDVVADDRAQLVEQAALADAGLARHQHDRAAPVARRPSPLGQHEGELVVAPEGRPRLRATRPWRAPQPQAPPP